RGSQSACGVKGRKAGRSDLSRKCAAIASDSGRTTGLMRPMSGETEGCDLSHHGIGSMNTARAMPAISFVPGNPGNVWQRNIWPESRRSFITGTVLILITLLCPFTVVGQNQPHTVATGQYVIDLPSAQWRAITVSGADYPRDFSFSDDNDVVSLRI